MISSLDWNTYFGVHGRKQFWRFHTLVFTSNITSSSNLTHCSMTWWVEREHKCSTLVVCCWLGSIRGNFCTQSSEGFLWTNTSPTRVLCFRLEVRANHLISLHTTDHFFQRRWTIESQTISPNVTTTKFTRTNQCQQNRQYSENFLGARKRWDTHCGDGARFYAGCAGRRSAPDSPPPPARPSEGRPSGTDCPAHGTCPCGKQSILMNGTCETVQRFLSMFVAGVSESFKTYDVPTM